MANYIQLLDKTGTPVSFQEIDEKLCNALNVPCDEKRYYCGWYDIVGYSGKDNIRDIIQRFSEEIPTDNKLIQALTWIDENYTLNAWYSRC